jgi:hypothetical protein
MANIDLSEDLGSVNLIYGVDKSIEPYYIEPTNVYMITMCIYPGHEGELLVYPKIYEPTRYKLDIFGKYIEVEDIPKLRIIKNYPNLYKIIKYPLSEIEDALEYISNENEKILEEDKEEEEDFPLEEKTIPNEVDAYVNPTWVRTTIEFKQALMYIKLYKEQENIDILSQVIYSEKDYPYVILVVGVFNSYWGVEKFIQVTSFENDVQEYKEKVRGYESFLLSLQIFLKGTLFESVIYEDIHIPRLYLSQIEARKPSTEVLIDTSNVGDDGDFFSMLDNF